MMEPVLENLLIAVLQFDIESDPNCEELHYLIHILDRSNRRIIMGGYDDPEDYYRECLPAEYLDIRLDESMQVEISDRLVSRVSQKPERSELLFVLSKIHHWIAISPLLKLIVETGDRFSERTVSQANFTLNAFLLDLHPEDEVKGEVMAFNNQPEIKAFVNRSLDSKDETVRELAENNKQLLESFGFEF